jgi:hypothetical protein
MIFTTIKKKRLIMMPLIDTKKLLLFGMILVYFVLLQQNIREWITHKEQRFRSEHGGTCL